MTLRLTSLLLVEERLLEADYFVGRLRRSAIYHLPYNLNAFLSAARSVTFLLQKEMAHVPGFAQWWEARRAELGADAAARFFLALRNFSQKEGRVRTMGYRGPGPNSRWRHSFAGGSHVIPDELYDRDVADCCSDHLAKLARLTLQFADAFPARSCPHRALTLDGVAELGVSVKELAAVAGLPDEWFDAAPHEVEAQLGGLRTLVDAVNFLEIEKLARRRARSRRVDDGDAALRQLLLGSIERGSGRHAAIAAGILMGGLPSEDEG